MSGIKNNELIMEELEEFFENYSHIPIYDHEIGEVLMMSTLLKEYAMKVKERESEIEDQTEKKIWLKSSWKGAYSPNKNQKP